MATLAQANLPSDDEEDLDYCPSEDDEDNEKQKLPKQRKRGFSDETFGAVANAQGEDADDQDHLTDTRSDVKKAKIDAIWSQLNNQGAVKLKRRTPNAAKQGTAVNKPKEKQEEAWLREIGLGSSKNRNAAASGVNKSVAAAALAAAKSASSATAAYQHGRVVLTETRRFAGKDITVKTEVAADSNEAQQTGTAGSVAKDNSAAVTKKKAGLDAVLASLSQPKKVTVLDKSRSDWKEFKGTDEHVEEELESYKKSSSTYLSKKEFLQRAELREYEQERDKRLASDMRNRGRL